MSKFKKKILIEGMSCIHGINHLKEALINVGALEIDVNVTNKWAIMNISLDIKDEEIKLVFENAGYEVVGIEKI